MQDLRYALRTLNSNRAFAAVAILTLALGIGATTSIFSVVNAVLLRDLPYRDPERLVMIWEQNARRPERAQNVVSPANLRDWQARNNVFEDMTWVVMMGQPAPLTGSGEPEELMRALVGGNYFRVLGVAALHGRTFNDEESRPGGPPAVVLSHALWMRRFGGDPSIVGRSLALAGTSSRVAGVMPASFQPIGPKADLWVAGALDPAIDYRSRAGRYLLAFGRLKRAATVERARSEMSAIARNLEEQYPDFNKNWGVNLVPMKEQFSQDLELALKVLLGAVGFLLLIACANVANLQLARAAAREREIAVRLSLGAGRWRLVRQLLVESLVIAVAAGALGAAMAVWGVSAILGAAPKDLPLLDTVSVDGRALAFAIAVSLVAGVLFGIAPALTAAGTRLNVALKEGGRGASGGARTGRLRDAFVVLQVGVALLLLIGAGLTIRSFLRLMSVKPGYRTDSILTMRVSLPGSKYREPHQRVEFFREAVERMRALPGVESAGSIAFLPLTGLGSATSWYATARPKPGPGQFPTTDVRVVRPGYFRTMGIPLLQGRDISDADTLKSPRVFVINETMARKHWPNENPIGQKIVVHMGDDTPGEIVGVVGDIRHMGLDTPSREMVYYAHPHLAFSFMTFVIRTGIDPERMTRAAVGVVRAIDPEQPVADIRTMESLVAQSVTPARFRMLLLAVFSGVALILAFVGIYGVVSYAVAQRRREMGVRMALGARPADVFRLVLAKSSLLGLAGVALGVAGALALTRVLARLLFEVKPTDPPTFAALALAMMAAVTVAALAPARRATRVDPMSALREE
jgi:putative ABC transport system permease protein